INEVCKYLPMNQNLVYFLVLLIFAFGFILGLSSPNITGFFVADVAGNKQIVDNTSLEKEIPTFRVYTKAICNNVSGFIVCRDEILANCGDFEYILPNTKVNGKGIFEEEWKDPRQS
ncbi:MAG: hypothetical protein ABIA04_05655, partial [Pseudomonadota bacterium]